LRLSKPLTIRRCSFAAGQSIALMLDVSTTFDLMKT
jgi:hypothetical protein